MKPILFAWGQVVIPSFGFFLAIGFLVAGFVLWRQMRSDYDEEEVITFSLFLGLCALLGARIVAIGTDYSRFGSSVIKWTALVSYPGLSFYGAVTGLIVGTWWFSVRRKWLFWETLDAAVVSGLWTVLFGGIGAFLSSALIGIPTKLPWGVSLIGVSGIRHPLGLYLSFLALMVLGVLGWLRSRYRSFSWYPSGKPGFLAILGLEILAIGLLALEFLREGGIYFWGIRLTQVLIGFFLVLSAWVLYERSGRSLEIDKSSVLDLLKRRSVLKNQRIRSEKNKSSQQDS